MKRWLKFRLVLYKIYIFIIFCIVNFFDFFLFVEDWICFFCNGFLLGFLRVVGDVDFDFNLLFFFLEKFCFCDFDVDSIKVKCFDEVGFIFVF